MRNRAGLAGLAAAIVFLAACSKPPASHDRVTGNPSTSPTPNAGGSPNPLPPLPSESGAAGEAPVVWVGGTLVDVTDRQVVLTEALGSKVELKRLGQDATAFFRIVGGAWQRLDPGTALGPGELACVETLLDGENLLALRVFLGANCGPAG